MGVKPASTARGSIVDLRPHSWREPKLARPRFYGHPPGFGPGPFPPQGNVQATTPWMALNLAEDGAHDAHPHRTIRLATVAGHLPGSSSKLPALRAARLNYPARIGPSWLWPPAATGLAPRRSGEHLVGPPGFAPGTRRSGRRGYASFPTDPLLGGADGSCTHRYPGLGRVASLLGYRTNLVFLLLLNDCYFGGPGGI